MNDDDEPTNVFRFGAINGGKSEASDDEGIPENDYVIMDIDGTEFYATGFMIFTPHHLAIMAEAVPGKGPIPVLVMPIARVKAAELYDEAGHELFPDS